MLLTQCWINEASQLSSEWVKEGLFWGQGVSCLLWFSWAMQSIMPPGSQFPWNYKDAAATRPPLRLFSAMDSGSQDATQGVASTLHYTPAGLTDKQVCLFSMLFYQVWTAATHKRALNHDQEFSSNTFQTINHSLQCLGCGRQAAWATELSKPFIFTEEEDLCIWRTLLEISIKITPKSQQFLFITSSFIQLVSIMNCSKRNGSVGDCSQKDSSMKSRRRGSDWVAAQAEGEGQMDSAEDSHCCYQSGISVSSPTELRVLWNTPLGHQIPRSLQPSFHL